MPGSMRQRGSTWELKVYLGRDAVSGRKRWAYRTFKGAKREAQLALAAFVVDADQDGLARTGATVGELLEEWFTHAAPSFPPKTVVETRGVLDRNLMPFLATIPLTKLGAADLDRFYRRLCDKGGRSGRPLAASTHPPHPRHPAPGPRAGRALGLAAAQPGVVGQPAPRPDSRRPPAVAGRAGPAVRSGRRCRPRPGRLHPPGRRHRRPAQRAGGAPVVRRRPRRRARLHQPGHRGRPDGLVAKDTKTHAARRVSLDATCVAALAAHRRRADERASVCGRSLPPDAFVFSNEVDGSVAWYPDSASRSFTRLCRRAGVSGVRPHDLRHYVATRLLSAGVDVRTVAGRLGHRNAATTLNVYSHFLVEADRQAADVLGRIFDDAVVEGAAAPAAPAGRA